MTVLFLWRERRVINIIVRPFNHCLDVAKTSVLQRRLLPGLKSHSIVVTQFFSLYRRSAFKRIFRDTLYKGI